MTQPATAYGIPNGLPSITGTSQTSGGVGAMGAAPASAPGQAGGALGDAYAAVGTAPVGMDLDQYGYLQGQANAAAGGLGAGPAGYQTQIQSLGNQLAGPYGLTAQMGNTVQGMGQTQNAIQGQIGGMQGTAQQLQAESQGAGPNPAAVQMQQGLQQAQNYAQAQAGSARGNFGLANAQKNAMNSGAAMGQQAALQGSQLAQQQQLAAQQQLMAQQQNMVGANNAIGALQAAQLQGQVGVGNTIGLNANLVGSAANLQQQQAQDYLGQATLSGNVAGQQANVALGSSAQALGAQEFNVNQGDQEMAGIAGAGSSMGSMGAMGGGGGMSGAGASAALGY